MNKSQGSNNTYYGWQNGQSGLIRVGPSGQVREMNLIRLAHILYGFQLFKFN